MNLVGGTIGGLIAGIIGAALWAAVAYYGEVEIGWLAWGIGAAVGFGVSAGSRGGGVPQALIAVLITVASLCGGKFAMVQMMMPMDMELEYEMSREDLAIEYALEIAKEKADAGEEVPWPNGMTLEEAYEPNDFPADIMQDAEQKAAALSDDEFDKLRKERDEATKKMMAELKQSIFQQAFMNSFSGFDVIFFLLGIVTAWQVGDVGSGAGLRIDELVTEPQL